MECSICTSVSSYYFHTNHCVESLEYCNGEIEDALELLYNKYLKVKLKGNEYKQQFSEKELLEQRSDEKSVLESMYDKAFCEKIKNSVWIITLKLDYLIELLMPKKKPKTILQQNKHGNKNGKKKEMCRNFLSGANCKYGSNCRFSHAIEAKQEPENPHLDNYSFELEIRFPKNCVYPYEPPLIFLKTNAPLPDLQMCLHISKRLHKEAENLSEDGFPCVYSILDLLQNEEEIIRYIQSGKIDFLQANEKLFPTDKSARENGLARPSHYEKGVTTKNSKQTLTLESMMKDNEGIVKRFR